MIKLPNYKKEQKEFIQNYIDLNCDIGQSFGVYRNETELDLLPYSTSANISCGAHAGDPLTLVKALKQAQESGLAVGAHIGYPDLQGFGYREMNLDDEEIQALVLYQIGAISALAKSYGIEIEHLRPHGALYKQASQDINVSLSIAKAIKSYNPWLIYVGAAGEALDKVSESTGIKVAHEVMLDKIYNFDGSIDFEAGDIANLDYSKGIITSLIKHSTVENKKGGYTKIKFDTVHLSLKSQYSLEIAKCMNEAIVNKAPMAVSIVKDTSWI